MTLATFGRWAYLLVAIAAWVGVVFTLVITGVDGYSREAVARPGMFGGAPFGWAGFGQRMIECLSYFTEWSNILVAIVATLIVWKGPDIGSWGRALQLCALMMITVTAIVYHFLIRPTEVLSGWSVFTNPLQHVVVPALMILGARCFGCAESPGDPGDLGGLHLDSRGFCPSVPLRFCERECLGLPAGPDQHRCDFVRCSGISCCHRWN